MTYVYMTLASIQICDAFSNERSVELSYFQPRSRELRCNLLL